MRRLRKSLNVFIEMELYNYHDIISKKPINCLEKKKDIYFYEMLIFKQFYEIKQCL